MQDHERAHGDSPAQGGPPTGSPPAAPPSESAPPSEAVPPPAGADHDAVDAPGAATSSTLRAKLAVAVVLTALALAVVVALSRGDGSEPDPTATTTTSTAPTTTQLSQSLSIAALLPLDEQFAPLWQLLEDSDVLGELDGDDVTLFATSAAAFGDDAPFGSAEALRSVMVEGAITRADLLELDGATLTALDGTELSIQVDDGRVSVAGAALSKYDIFAANGVIHVTDEVPELT